MADYPECLEDQLAEGTLGADLVLYPLSPTTTYPATGPMVDPAHTDEGEFTTYMHIVAVNMCE